MGGLLHINDFVAASQGDAQSILRKFFYFPLLNLLVGKAQLSELCESMGISYSGGIRLSAADAFRSATEDIKEREPVTVASETNTYLIYCRDNRHTADTLSRELVRETLNQKTNRYEKLANTARDRKDGQIYYTDIVMGPDIDVQARCRRAGELFELYQRHANRKQVETIYANFLRKVEATKPSISGRLYFVPKSHMGKVDIFGNSIGLLGGMNRNNTPLVVDSFYIADDEKQRSKMAEELYNAVEEEIAEYQGRYDYFIKSNCQGPAAIERWVLKVRGLEKRRRHYEEILRRELDGLNEEFSMLKLLSQELQVRANAIHLQKTA